MQPDFEIRRLLDVMPASGRMRCKIISKPVQSTVISYQSVLPFTEQTIAINFDLWSRLSKGKRDLLILRAVAWSNASNWLKPELYQGLFAAGFVGAIAELWQADAIGILVSGSLSGMAALQIWRNSRGLRVELAADEQAVQTALRRGYSETEAAQQLLAAIQAVAQLENRPNPSFDELIRCQNLRAIAGLTPTSVPETLQ